MTRSKSGDLHPYDLEIDKTFHRLSRNNRSRSVVVHVSVVFDSNVVHTKFIVDSISDFVSEPVFIAFDSKKNSVDITVDNNQTLKELATPDVVYQPWCIQYPETKVSYELQSGLIHLLLMFHGLVGEDPHKHLKEFHVVCSTMRLHDIHEYYVKMKAFPFSLDGVAKDWLYIQPYTINT